MPNEIVIPRLGWSMDEGVFAGWLKKDGDPVKVGEPLFTLEGEKSAQDIESTDSGILRIQKDSPPNGATVKVGQVIGLLVGANEVVESAKPAEPKPTDQIRTPQTESPNFANPVGIADPLPANGKMAEKPEVTTSSPRARRRAKEVGVDLNQLHGSGDHGRIIEKDVLQASISHSVSPGTPRESKPVAAAAGQVSSMRRGIAERTALSFSQIPHFYLRMEVDATVLVKMREHLVAILEKECGVRITLTDFLLRAQAKALGAFPAANAVWKDNGVVKFTDADVGVVVGLPDGLMIPVISAAQNMSLVQIAKERTRLVNAVRGGRYVPEAVSGGASSLSNLGTSRTDEFTAIIPPHQSSILAVGRAAPRPYVVDSRLEIRTTLQLCLSMDHRVLDGGPAADFLGKIVELLENPKMLIEDI